MVSCPGCGGTYAADDLVRHEHERLLVVHCPDCNRLIGRYRRHGDRGRGR